MTTEEQPSSELVRGLLDPSPSELFRLVRYDAEGKRTESSIRVKKLRVDETHDALAAAQKYAKERGELPGYADIYREGQAVEVLLRSICYPEIEVKDGVKRLRRRFVSAEQMRQSLDETEMAQCLNMYEIVKAKFGAIEEMNEAELDRWIDKLADPLEGELFLSLLDSKQWPLMILSLARLVRSLRPPTIPTQSSSEHTSESIHSTSRSGTTTSSRLPSAQSEDGKLELPTNKRLSKSEARELVKQSEEPPAKPEGD